MFFAIIIVCLLTGCLCYFYYHYYYLLLFAYHSFNFARFISLWEAFIKCPREISLGAESLNYVFSLFWTFVRITHILCKTNTFCERRRMKRNISQFRALQMNDSNIFRTKHTLFVNVCVFAVLCIRRSKCPASFLPLVLMLQCLLLVLETHQIDLELEFCVNSNQHTHISHRNVHSHYFQISPMSIMWIDKNNNFR